MRVAISTADGRISPVLDAAEQALVIEVCGGRLLHREHRRIAAPDMVTRAKRLAALGAQELICGAISRELEQILVATGLRIRSNTCGDVEQIVAAVLDGRMEDKCFQSPACRRQPSRQRRR